MSFKPTMSKVVLSRSITKRDMGIVSSVADACESYSVDAGMENSVK